MLIGLLFTFFTISASADFGDGCGSTGITKLHQFTSSWKRKASPYSGCLSFQDDVRAGDDLSATYTLKPDVLLRSWYRFGEPAADKNYSGREGFVKELNQKKIQVGGGSSLSVINDRDLARKDFDPSWRTVDLDGKPYAKDGENFASLSAPGFRSYLVKNLVEQAKLGMSQLSLGETAGKIHFDDWTLGLKGDDGFVQWIKKKNPHQTEKWWKEYLGDLGVSISKGLPITRSQFQSLKGEELSHFKSEWGKADSWHGTNEKDQPAFLAYAYRQNLQKFMKELKFELSKNGCGNVPVDVWGSADWMKKLTPAPDAVLNSPPDERWGLNWNTDPNFDLAKNRERIKSLMKEDAKAAAPSKLVYMFDHPKPFLTSFAKLSDTRQAELTRYFSELSREVGANFVFRSYSEVSKGAGPETKKVMSEECQLNR